MYVAISVIKIFSLISLGLAFLLGQGWLLTGPVLHGSLITEKRNIPLLQEIPLMLMSGLIINYGIILCFQSIKVSLIIGCVISIFGLCCFGLHTFRYHIRQSLSPEPINKWIGIIFTCLLFLSPILCEPLREWDARSIWFFHAKMIYEANSIGLSAGWQHPSIIFSHPDYPKLLPTLAAQVTYVMGFWNEYIPKTSLFFMLVPGVIWLFTFARRSFSFAILFLLIPFGFSNWIWNGYMDGYLALYFSVAMLLLGRYINSSRFIDLVSSLCCLIALLYIKNEGALAALIGLCLAIPILFLKTKAYSVKKVFLENWKYCLIGLIVLIPFIVWSFYKHHWNLVNDLGLGTTQSYLNITRRLTDDSYKLIFQKLYEQIESALLLLGLLYFASVAWKKSLPKESIPALIAAGIYCLGMIVIYLLTPLDLTFHVNESINRTMLSVNSCIFIGSYYILNTIENNGKFYNS